MIEHTLWEGLPSGIAPQISGEPERLIYGQVSLDDEHRRTSHLHFFEDMSTPSVQHTINTTNSHLRTLDLALVYRFHQTWCRSQQAGIKAATSRRDDLSATSVDSISVQGYVIDVETHATQVLFS